MTLFEELVQDLKTLTPEQLDEVATLIQRLTSTTEMHAAEASALPDISKSIVEEAVLHGWPRELFTEVIGSLPEIERRPQPSYDARKTQ
jgi:hypothetical protein